MAKQHRFMCVRLLGGETIRNVRSIGRSAVNRGLLYVHIEKITGEEDMLEIDIDKVLYIMVDETR